MYTNCIKLRLENILHITIILERVGIEGRVVSGSDLIPLQYIFKDLVSVKRSL